MTQPTLTTRTLAETRKHVVVSATIEGGDEDLSPTILIDFSELTANLSGTNNKLSIQEVDWAADTCSIRILFDADTDDTGIILSRNGKYNLKPILGIVDPQSTGYTGDILIATTGYASNSTASLIIRCLKL